MVKRGARPSWHLALTAALLVMAAATVLLLHWRSRPQPHGPFGGRPIPTRPAAFADSLAAGIDDAVAEVGIWLELVEVRPRRAGPGGDSIYVRVPADLPLPMANLAVSDLVRRLDGRVVRGIEVDGPAVVLYCGPNQAPRGLSRPDSSWPAGATSRVELRREPRLARRTGRIAVVVDSLGRAARDAGLLERLLALPFPLTVHLEPEEAHSSRFAERLIEAGHQVVLAAPAAGALVIDADRRPEAIEDQLWELAFLAADRGGAVGTGRGRDGTLRALEAVLPRLESRGYELVTLAGLSR